MRRALLPSWLGIVFVASMSAGCLGDFQTPSAYQSQIYYCETANAPAFQALAQSCQSAGICTGALSMRGTMQGQPLTVGTTLQQSTVALVQANAMAPAFWDVLRLTGASPYFEFVLHIKSVGGDVTVDEARTLSLRAGAGALPTSLDDNLSDVGQTLQVGGANAEQQGLSDSGSIVLTKLTKAEIDGVFHGSFGTTNDVVDGCFIMYPDQIVTNPLPSP
ncbi:MAG: hypothetical protein JWN44_5010 [Myxococcales bacterium]|nr:hypothetical protein [Myxococcales bacterium]